MATPAVPPTQKTEPCRKRIHLDDPVPPRHARPSGRGGHGDEDCHAADPDERARLRGVDELRDRSDRDRFHWASTSTSVTVFPDKVNLTFNTAPTGLNIEVDGITKQAPFVLDDLKGFQHTINAPNQTSGGTSYAFSSWSDGGGQSHGIVSRRLTSRTRQRSRRRPGPPRGGLRIRRGDWGDRRRRLWKRQRRHHFRRDLDDVRQIRQSADLQRDERAGDGQ